jgi:CRISPR/Cas system CSM-associated protein Csm3 (group 7 of RAMP superfamily)
MNVTLIRFTLRMDEPGGVLVPAPIQRDEPDLVADRDPWGRPQIPGTSIAGALREMVRDYVPANGYLDASDRLFGRLLAPGSVATTTDSEASAIWVLGSRMVDEHGAWADPVAGPTRATTAIDRHRAAARAHSLWLEELLPAGTRFEVYLRWDDAEAADLDAFLTHLLVWQPMLGHGVSRGRGRCAVEKVRYGSLDLTVPADLIRWITGSGPDLVREVAGDVFAGADAPPANGVAVLVKIPVRIIGPLHVGSGRSERPTAGDAPKEALIVDEDGPSIPGSTLKGLFRSRMEYILRSVAGGDAACQNQQCGTCWPCQVLGFAGGNDRRLESVGLRGRLRFCDAPVTDVETGSRTHVAIDRFTGGAGQLTADSAAAAAAGQQPDTGGKAAETGRGLLFTLQTLEAGSFTVTVEDLGLDTEQRTDSRALLRLVMEDLNDGLIGVGGGVARGYGSVTVDTAEVEPAGGLPSLAEARRRLALIVAPPGQ